jgi:hypothetical protein
VSADSGLGNKNGDTRPRGFEPANCFNVVPILIDYLHHLYSRLKEHKKGTLSPERIAALEQLGFIWDARRRPAG